MKTPHAFGVPSCRLLSLGEGGGLLHLVCPQPAGWLSRLGLYHTGLLAVRGALCAVCPGGVRLMHVGSTVPFPASRGGCLDQAP